MNVEVDRVVTGTVLRVGSGLEATFKNWIVDPGIEIPEAAAKIHKYTTERARAEGGDPVVAVAEMRDALLAAWDRGEPVVVYNAPYDFTLLDRELARHGHVRLPATLGPVIDPLVIDKFNDPFRKGSRKLIDTCRHYSITLPEKEAHTSWGDTMAAARLAYMVAGPKAGVTVRVGWGRNPTFEDRRGVVHRMSLDELHRAQIGWADEQRRGFAAHKAKTSPEEGRRILEEIGWPIRPEKVLSSEPPPF